jgi:hypothetical protein
MFFDSCRSPELAKDSHERILYFRSQLIEFQMKNPVTHAISAESSLLSLTRNHESQSQSSCFSLIHKNFESYLLLVWRCFTESRRDVATQRIRIFIALFFCLVVGGLYSNGDSGQSSIYNRAGFFFFISINQGYSAVTSAVNVLVREKVIVNRLSIPSLHSSDDSQRSDWECLHLLDLFPRQVHQ